MDQYWYESMKDVGAILDENGNPVVTYQEFWDYLDKQSKIPKKVNAENYNRLVNVYNKTKALSELIEGSEINKFVYNPQYSGATVILFLNKVTTFSGKTLQILKDILRLTNGASFYLSNEDKIRINFWISNVWEDAE